MNRRSIDRGSVACYSGYAYIKIQKGDTMRYYIYVLFILALVGCSGQSDFEASLTVDDGIQAITAAGLECMDPQPMDDSGESLLPKTFIEGIRCTAPSVADDHGIRVMAFDSERDLLAVYNYYDQLGENFGAMFGTYVFRHKNLVLQTNHSMSKALSVEYQAAFESID